MPKDGSSSDQNRYTSSLVLLLVNGIYLQIILQALIVQLICTHYNSCNCVFAVMVDGQLVQAKRNKVATTNLQLR